MAFIKDFESSLTFFEAGGSGGVEQIVVTLVAFTSEGEWRSLVACAPSAIRIMAGYKAKSHKFEDGKERKFTILQLQYDIIR